MAESEDRYQPDERTELFQPDVVLPKQYFDALKRKKYPTGEHRLLVAILRDAVDCFQKYANATDQKRRQLYLDAESWIDAAEDQGQFSFNNVCDLLGMNPDYVREGLLAWRDVDQRREERAYRERQAAEMFRRAGKAARSENVLYAEADRYQPLAAMRAAR
jgi:hypothetical protein